MNKYRPGQRFSFFTSMVVEIVSWQPHPLSDDLYHAKVLCGSMYPNGTINSRCIEGPYWKLLPNQNKPL